jgi:hypothetical protein
MIERSERDVGRARSSTGPWYPVSDEGAVELGSSRRCVPSCYGAARLSRHIPHMIMVQVSFREDVKGPRRWVIALATGYGHTASEANTNLLFCLRHSYECPAVMDHDGHLWLLDSARVETITVYDSCAGHESGG